MPQKVKVTAQEVRFFFSLQWTFDRLATKLSNCYISQTEEGVKKKKKKCQKLNKINPLHFFLFLIIFIKVKSWLTLKIQRKKSLHNGNILLCQRLAQLKHR